ncbi:sensor domain-containing phosphodiesterase [Heyndrickxia ginsengihumi]|uniref:sensor domain-containing phosphodiesterase n=1 Tax=Heyndrickxia ginsengihumi TaxID=363870 RepID=UPI00203D6729|nr:EAL domain-containing protein [Heyndrickxia ginsengihumi]MCM3024710.1 EAL domain-containing protein [Heyndrickxia ginsengihumi]
MSNLEKNLKKALKLGEFRLFYQPKLDLTLGKIIGVEALIRWQHEEKGLISPLDFIPIAEKTGLILPIGEWVLRTACKQNKDWQEAGFPPMVMAVNLSARQLYQANLIEMVARILKETGLSPQYLELEITESMMMEVEYVLEIVKKLKQIGVQISLDDFGTGYSSLYYLKEFPFDSMKIDKCFVRNCTEDIKDATIVKTIIAMAHELDIDVIAEGIESKGQLIFLQQNLCNKGQGYLFSKPVPSEEFIRTINEVESIVKRKGISQEENKKKWREEALQSKRQELHDAVRMHQGFIFKFVKQEDKFIHTLCDGDLLYQMDYTPEQIIGSELKDFLPEEAAKQKLQFYQKAWEGEEHIIYEGEINSIHYFATLRPVRKGGKVVEVIGSCIDITKRKKLEEHLQISAYKFRLIAENMPDITGILDVTGRVEYVSPSCEALLGYLSSEHIGSLAFDFIHPHDLAAVEDKYMKIIQFKQPCEAEFRYRHANGSWLYVDAQITPVMEKNEIKYLVVVARDITKEKQKEINLAPLDNRMRFEQSVNMIKQELECAKKYMEQSELERSSSYHMENTWFEIKELEKKIQELLMRAKSPTK